MPESKRADIVHAGPQSRLSELRREAHLSQTELVRAAFPEEKGYDRLSGRLGLLERRMIFATQQDLEAIANTLGPRLGRDPQDIYGDIASMQSDTAPSLRTRRVQENPRITRSH